MRSLKKEIHETFDDIRLRVQELKNNQIFLWLLLGTVVLTFGFKLTHITYNNDVPYAFDSEPLGLLHQMRFGHSVFALLGLLDRFVPFWSDAVGIIFFVAAALCWRWVFQIASGNNLSNKALAFFVLLFISFPLHFDFFLFPGGILMMGIVFGLIGFAHYLLLRTSWVSKLLAVFLVALATGTYESSAVLFITGTVMVLLLREIFGKGRTSFSTRSEQSTDKKVRSPLPNGQECPFSAQLLSMLWAILLVCWHH